MTDNEIIKTLECCTTNESCSKCQLNYEDYCRAELLEQAFTLIKRQKAEIEKLKVEIDRNTGKYIINARNEGIRDFADKVTQNKDSLFNLMYSEVRFKRGIYKLANELIKGRTEKNKSMEMNFKITGFKMNGENAVGMVDENGFTFSILDKTGQPIPLNKESIENFLKDNKAKAEKGF